MARFATLTALNVDDALPDAWVDEIKAAHDYLIVAGEDLASAATLTITSEFHIVTGTTTIDNIADASTAVKGQQVKLIFSGAGIQVRHNGGGTGNIRLRSGLAAGFVANEMLHLVYNGTSWFELGRTSPQLTGQSIEWNTTTVPAGYAIEDGSAISRTTYAALFTNLSTVWGTGDGSTTFNVPDSRGRVTVGYAASGGHSDVSTIAANEGSSAGNRRPKHPHTFNLATGDFYDPGGASTTARGLVQLTGLTTFTVPVSGTIGAAGVADDAPAYIVRPKLIRV